MLTAHQHDEFRATGLLRLGRAFPQDAATAMCDRLLDFLARQYAIHRGKSSTWTVEQPARFQPVSQSSAFRFRLDRVRTSPARHPWLRGQWMAGDNDGDRIQRCMNDDTVIDGVPLRVVELTGEPGDVVLMHPPTHSPGADDSPSQ